MRHRPRKATIERENDPRRGVSVSTLARDYARGSCVELHSHGSDQLIYASRGVMEVASGDSVWMLPPQFGLWIPARIPHHIRMPERVSMRTLYLRPALTQLERTCKVLHAGPLMRELIFEIVRVGQLRYRNRLECALCSLFIDQLKRASPVPTGVALPKDQRALAVAQAVLANPAIRTSMQSMCASTGVGVRTLQRIFLREVGTDFEFWRRQVRLMRAIELLVSGGSVKEVSFAVGYQNPSAFVALFRGTFGTTPKAWVSTLIA
jgi:AraC-like DNA-binding protein